MLTEKQEKQRSYIERINREAERLALANIDELHFDPQGRVLINVVPTEEERTLFKEATGREPSTTTTVSIDVSAHPALQAAYMQQYGLTGPQFEQISKIKGSIIPLQQEFHFHLGLAGRTYTAMDKERFPEDKMNAAHEAAMARVNKEVISAFQKALDKATDPKTGLIDDVKLIKEMDKARKAIFSKAHDIFVEEVVVATGERLTKKDMKAMDVKHTAEITTASSNDFLHVGRPYTDPSYKGKPLGQYTLIEGTEVTAHDRGPGIEHLANRQIMTYAITDDFQGTPRIQIRTPSLDVKEGIISEQDRKKGKKGITEEEAITDVAAKLEHLQTFYNMQDVKANPVLGTKAFTYNLLTALNDNLEGGKNKQSQGARFILAGSHEYNAKQLNESKDPVFCFVQNISVNGFGDSLGYDGNDLKTEATLMSEMAMLYNLGAEGDNKDTKINAVFKNYEDYLKSNPREQFFSQSKFGKEAIEQIKAIKGQWAQEAQQQNLDGSDTVAKAKGALKAMMANDLHHQHEFAKVIQAMSIFTEQASIAGCKSGNERAQAIAGRVSDLDDVAHDDNDPVVKAMVELANASPKDVEAKAQNLKSQIDQKYDKKLQGGVAAISHLDQGAAAKVNAKRGLAGLYNRNYAEESTLEHLHQDKAGKMQAHKGLTKEMTAALDSRPQGLFDYMRSKLGTVGMVLATISGIGIAIAAGFHSAYKKDLKAQYEERMNQALEKHYEKKIDMVLDSHEQAKEQAKTEEKKEDVGLTTSLSSENTSTEVIDFRKKSERTIEVTPNPEPPPLSRREAMQHMHNMKGVLQDIKKNGELMEQRKIQKEEVSNDNVDERRDSYSI